MSVGDLVTFVDWDSTGGFGTPEKYVGLVVAIPKSRCLPPIIDILPPNEIITVHADEVERVKS